jgi:hypothetical protein
MQECNSMNNVVLTYLSELVGILSKIVTSVHRYGRDKGLVCVSVYSYAHDVRPSTFCREQWPQYRWRFPTLHGYDSRPPSPLTKNNNMPTGIHIYLATACHVGPTNQLSQGFILQPFPVAQCNYRVFPTKGCSWFGFPRCWVWSMSQNLSLTRRNSALLLFCFIYNRNIWQGICF